MDTNTTCRPSGEMRGSRLTPPLAVSVCSAPLANSWRQSSNPLPVVAREDDAVAIRRDVRLVIVGAIGMSQFDRDIGLEALAPQ